MTAVPCRATANTAPSAVGCDPPDHPPESSARSDVVTGAAASTVARATSGVATTIQVRSCTAPSPRRKKQAGCGRSAETCTAPTRSPLAASTAAADRYRHGPWATGCGAGGATRAGVTGGATADGPACDDWAGEVGAELTTPQDPVAKASRPPATAA